ncbi:hypothetical protein GH5_01803 [Leishmania sp. Ghana 2012 LV757]|uniref:hypothetical protein n=1 Tax=Leishmania sp. Ghana 2012 LV757 TaxID=2803181 RepID=UPI001B52D255|nr:hypothetical protein GH5_01803 [Leishmania sp. Ghana 2012 LV757]
MPVCVCVCLCVCFSAAGSFGTGSARLARSPAPPLSPLPRSPRPLSLRLTSRIPRTWEANRRNRVNSSNTTPSPTLDSASRSRAPTPLSRLPLLLLPLAALPRRSHPGPSPPYPLSVPGYEAAKMECKIGLILYVILQFIAFLLVLVGTPLDMFRGSGEQVINKKACITLWGFKNDCHSSKYDNRSDELWASCPGRRSRFRAAQAFAVISIFVYGAGCLLGLLSLYCCYWLRWVCLGLNILGIVTLCITWASMVVVFHDSEGDMCHNLDSEAKLAAGFALLLTAWCLDIIDILFLFLPF